MKPAELIARLQQLAYQAPDQDVLIDTGTRLCAIDDIDLGASDEGIIIWTGDVIDEH